MKKRLFVLLAVLFFSVISAEETPQKERFYLFYSESCPHCHEAMPFIESLEKEFPDIEFNKLEVSAHPEHLAVFNKKMEKLGTQAGGVPTFVFRDKYVVGFKKGAFEEKIRAMITVSDKKPAAAKGGATEKNVPASDGKAGKSETPEKTAQPGKTPEKTAPAPAGKGLEGTQE